METGQRILEVSAELFANKGYDGVSVREIAAAAGIRESSIYNHFAGKGEILDALLQRFIGNIEKSRPSDDELRGMAAIFTPNELLKNIIVKFGQTIDPVIDNTARIIYSEAFKSRKTAGVFHDSMVNESSAFYARVMKMLMSAGKIEDVDPEYFAEQYSYSLIFLSMEYAIAQGGYGNPLDVVKKMMGTVDFFCGILKRKSGQEE